MFKKALSCILSLALTASSLTALGAGFTAAAAENVEPNHHFYQQLNENAQSIYNVLYQMYVDGDLMSGTETVDLVEKGAVTKETLDAYIGGDRTLADDFSAAKDAFDLECSEAWYVDSSYLSLRVAQKADGEYAAYLGVGRDSTYLLPGLDPSQVSEMDQSLKKTVDKIVTEAGRIKTDGLSEADAAARKVRFVHEQVTKGISYRFETECQPDHIPYVRTLYALATHEGVCEGYARSMQVILNRLGIPCVLVHGVQNSGNAPEMHMWNAVELGDKWYAVDATWDDPIRLDKDGQRIEGEGLGNDGGEIESYLLVGAEVIGQNWLPSGAVSSGNMSFTYPTIEPRSYAGEEVFEDGLSGLHVQYTANGEMEDEVAGQFTVDYNGMGMEKAAEQGVYLLVKMYDEHPDGTSHKMEDWYYAAAALALLGKNEYFYDTDTCLKFCTATCEYVEFALTTTRPEGYDTWKNPPENNGLSKNPETGFYHGDGSDIISKTEMLYNSASEFEAAPCVYRQSPAPTGQLDTRQTFTIHIEFDDSMYHPALSEISPASITNPGAPETPDSRKAATEPVTVRFDCYQLDRDGEIVPYDLVGKISADSNRDYVLDEGVVTWIYDCEDSHQHNPEDCFVTGVEYQFQASTNWSDDLTLYDFSITGLVGSRSNKAPNSWSYVMSTSVCPMAYRSQGIDWALWGRPSLLDNPNDLDLSRLAVEGVDGSRETLNDLQKQMKIDDMNGRLMLTVEEIGKEDGMSREKYEEVTEAFDQHTNISGSAIKSSSMYEINFTRLCKMTVVLEGESLRMQLGFPAGYDASSVANKEVVFKAYHFTRCSPTKQCDHVNDPDHKYGDDIISVEEIPLAVTQYGLVILCDSFSPFELVALDASKVSADEMEKDHNIIVKTDGNGAVTCDGESTAGEKGFISFEEGQSHTFKVEPKAGFATDIVSFGGRSIPVGDNGTFSLSYYEIVGANDMLNVSFVPETVKQAEAESGIVSVVPKIVTEDPVIVITPNQERYTVTRGADTDIFCGAPTVNVLGADSITVSGGTLPEDVSYQPGEPFELAAPDKSTAYGTYYTYTVTAAKGDSTVSRTVQVRREHGMLAGRSTYVIESSCTLQQNEITMYRCRDCSRFYNPLQRSVAKDQPEHHLTPLRTVTAEQSCDGRSYTISQCSDCTYLEVKVGDETPTEGAHHWMPFVKESTCDADGISYEICADCEAVRSVLPSYAHAHFVGSSYKTSPSGDCTVDLVKKSVCSDCWQEFSQSITPNTAHSGGWKTVRHATCKDNGLQEWVCSYCEHRVEQEIPSSEDLHSYTSQVTKPATCTEAGVITHTCRYCGNSYTTEKPALGGDHRYEVVKTVSATCATDGVTTYQCTRCGHSYDENTPATGDHKWTDDNDCTTEDICRVCRKVMNPAVPHTFGDYQTRSWDTQNHYRECSVCHFVETEAHLGVDDGDCKTALYCQSCNALLKPAQTYHSPFPFHYRPLAGKEAQYHAAVCNVSGCTYQYTEGSYVKPHEFQGDTCTVCGYTRIPHDHQWGSYQSNETGHFQLCTICGIPSDTQPHDKSAENGYEGNCHDAVTCSICGYVVLPSHPEHTWCSDWHTDSECHYHNCTEPGCNVQQKFDHVGLSDHNCITPTLCLDCNYEMVAAGESHSWAVKPGNSDETTHLLECTNPDCDAESREAHVEGTPATCHEAAECRLCHTRYGPTNPDNHMGGDELRFQKPATYEEEGYTGDLYCLGCQQIKVKGSTIPPLEAEHQHSFTQYAHDDQRHWTVCSECGAIKEESTVAHEFDSYHNAGDAHYRECMLCHYRQDGIHEHSPEDYNCATAITCIYCSAIIEPAQQHNFSGRVECDQTGHRTACTNLNCRQLSETVAHSGGSASCVSGKHCEVCDFEYTERDPNTHIGETRTDGYKAPTETEKGYTGDVYCLSCEQMISEGAEIECLPPSHQHDFGEWIQTATHHYHECSCNTVEDMEEHNFGDYQTDGDSHYRACTVCGYRQVCSHLNAADDGNCETEVKCPDCGAVTKAAMTHQFSGNVTGDANGHRTACVNPDCTQQSDLAGHTGGTASCVGGKHCEVCGFEYTERDPEYHTGGTRLVGEKPATTETEGYTGDVYCLGCDQKITDGQVIDRLPAPHEHLYGGWQNDGTHHYRECTCGEKEEYGAHTYENGSCTVCGAIQPKADYTKLNEAVEKVPQDLTRYTKASAQAVKELLDQIDYNLTPDRQAEVDAMAKALEEAIAGLATRYLCDVNYDDEITVVDALLALRAAVGLDVLKGGDFWAANPDKPEEDTITVSDALLILRKAVGLA